ncbi:unnamed protein product [Clonostachys rosea]|uniref:Uncharacterized protein n=1 Tax=Bionectria ochroleuca TaxID=29856 RepID=A0ABY6TYI1_BIOOC|nr:unnamed protein product [Clonostachys rosea]
MSESTPPPSTKRTETMGTMATMVGSDLEHANSDHHDLSDNLEDYFVGPRDLAHHSKWPMFLQLHGSVTPRMILPIAFTGAWATAISCISYFVYNLGIDSVLLTVLGFVVGLSLSFRNSTAYERYAEGRKYWTQLSLATQNLARLVWVHVAEREGSEVEDLLAKVTFCNMLVTFAYALKHKLRFEPFTHYDDLEPRLKHLNVLAKKAEPRDFANPSTLRRAALALGFPMAESNPRKLIKKSTKPLGNVPLEILTYCSEYFKSVIDNETFKAPIYQTQALNMLTTMNDILTGTDRILNTPLPIAYSIAISQITWVYIIVLPFQLWDRLQWVTIPATMFAAYIILGLALIGREIENPFGDDVNDLPLEDFCQQIRREIDVIMASGAPGTEDFIHTDDNLLLHPLSNHGYHYLKQKTPEQVRQYLKTKMEKGVRNL